MFDTCHVSKYLCWGRGSCDETRQKPLFFCFRKYDRQHERFGAPNTKRDLCMGLRHHRCCSVACSALIMRRFRCLQRGHCDCTRNQIAPQRDTSQCCATTSPEIQVHFVRMASRYHRPRRLSVPVVLPIIVEKLRPTPMMRASKTLQVVLASVLAFVRGARGDGPRLEFISCSDDATAGKTILYTDSGCTDKSGMCKFSPNPI